MYINLYGCFSISTTVDLQVAFSREINDKIQLNFMKLICWKSVGNQAVC